MTKIILTCDDMNPSVIPIWMNTWDKLKQLHEGLKITAFTVPLWKGISENDVFKSKIFKKWYKERKEWVEIGQQGYTSSHPPECQRFRKPQMTMIKRGNRKIATYMPKNTFVFKPPYYRMDNNTIEILEQIGFSACVHHGKIILLKEIDKPIEDFILIESHINMEEKNPDDIQLIYKKMDKYLTDLESKYQYATFSELIEGKE